jgi:hypothetical protein
MRAAATTPFAANNEVFQRGTLCGCSLAPQKRSFGSASVHKQKYRAQYSEFKQKEGMMATKRFNRRSLIKAAAALGGSSTIAEFGDGMLAQTSTHSATTTRELNQRKEEIAKTPYTKEHAALLIVDPYNDFMSEGGKLFERTKETAMAVGFYDNMRKLIPAARAAGLRVFILPHHRSVEGDYDNWLAVNPSQLTAKTLMPFAVGTWGGEWHPEFGPRPGDIIIKEHWAQSSFANTDLDCQFHFYVRLKHRYLRLESEATPQKPTMIGV